MQMVSEFPNVNTKWPHWYAAKVETLGGARTLAASKMDDYKMCQTILIILIGLVE